MPLRSNPSSPGTTTAIADTVATAALPVEDAAIHPGTRATLYAPGAAMAGCVRAYMGRSTEAVVLSHAQRHNHFPATLWSGITWLVKGDATLLTRGQDLLNEAVPPVVFFGPHTDPVVSVNSGPVVGFSVLLMPDALQELAGVDVAKWVNQAVDVRQVLGRDWLPMVRGVAAATSDAERIRLIEAFVAPRWESLRKQTVTRGKRYRQWVDNLLLRTATSSAGAGVRQLQRRIKKAAGLPLRDLERIARMEDAFFKARDLAENGAWSQSELAHEMGLADQSHLCREIKRISGLSPGELARAIEERESFWAYRVWD